MDDGKREEVNYKDIIFFMIHVRQIFGKRYMLI